MNSTREAFAARLSGDEFTAESALDALNRSAYEDDDAYLDAAAKALLERSSPEYQRARAAATAAYQRRQEAEQRAAQEARYKELSSTTKLDYLEISNAERQARVLAQTDLTAGRIHVSNMGATIEKYTEKFQKEALKNKISRIMMNEAIRGMKP